MFVEAFFQLSLRVSKTVLFIVASSSFYHVCNVFRIAVNAVVNGVCVSCREKCIICLSFADVFACTAAVAAATKGAKKLVRGSSGA